MTISVNIIEGRRGSVCNNDAFSVVANGRELIDIIPADDIPGKTSADVERAFNKASGAASKPAEIREQARLALGLTR